MLLTHEQTLTSTEVRLTVAGRPGCPVAQWIEGRRIDSTGERAFLSGHRHGTRVSTESVQGLAHLLNGITGKVVEPLRGGWTLLDPPPPDRLSPSVVAQSPYYGHGVVASTGAKGNSAPLKASSARVTSTIEILESTGFG